MPTLISPHPIKLRALSFSFFCFAVLAAAASPALEVKKGDAAPALFTACHTTLADLDKNLKAVEQKSVNWAHTQSAKELSSVALGDNSNGRQVMLFSANLLPKGSPFLALDRQCWIHYVDLERAAARSDRSATQTALSRWTNCLPISFGETPPEALELIDCVGSIPLSKTK